MVMMGEGKSYNAASVSMLSKPCTTFGEPGYVATELDYSGQKS